jgi:hypothetical protein
MTKSTEPANRRWLGAIRRLAGGGAAGTSEAVPVELTLRWGGATGAANVVFAFQAARACDRAVDQLLADLGIPGRSEATVNLAGPGGADPYALRVNGRRACLAVGELEAIVADVTGAATAIQGIPGAAVAEVAAAVCVSALHRRLSVLLREEHGDRILPADGARPHGPRGPDVNAVLAAVVDNGVSLKEPGDIRRVLADARGNESVVQLAELVIEKLRSASVDILCAGQTMRQITTKDPGIRHLFVDLRTRIFNDIGIEFPDIHFVCDGKVPEGCFAFRFNAAATAPRHLGEGEGLNEVVAVFEQDLRRRAAWYITLTGLEELIGQLKLLPDTVQAVQARYPRAWLSAVGRKALDEGLSLRQISTLLDWTIDLDPEALPGGTVRLGEGPAPIGTADGDQFLPPRDAVALIRQRWMEELVQTPAAGASRYVRRLPAALEQAAEDGSLVSDDSAQSELAAVVQAIAADHDKPPIVVSTLAARARLRDALAPEFPDVQVCAELEYPAAIRLVEIPPPK